MNKIAIIAIMLLILSANAFADGMIVRPCYAGEMASPAGEKQGTASLSEVSRWCPHRESAQRAIINYENGNENLLLFVKTQGNPETEKFLWIFPVPAKPEQISIDNLKGFPNLYGTSLKQQFRDNLGILAVANFVAWFPPAGIVFLGLLFTGVASSSGEMYKAQAVGLNEVDRGYDIWAHVTKYGISTEVMTAWDSEKFYHYLEVRGTNIEPEAKKRIQEYIGKDYSFIVSWVSNPEEFRTQNTDYYNQEPIGVFVAFPTDKLYFPMKMTSIYENDYVPATIDVIGYKDPEIFSNISKETRVEYYFNNRLQYGLNEEESALKVFNGKIPEQLRFTRISINAQAKYFVQDLWISNNASVAASALEAINAIWILLAIIIFFCLSFAAIWLANKLVLGNFLGTKRIAILAATNFLTMICFAIAVFAMRSQMTQKEKAKFKWLKAIAVSWAIFFGLSILFAIIVLGITAIVK